jgi:hypothetical protein
MVTPSLPRRNRLPPDGVAHPPLTWPSPSRVRKNGHSLLCFKLVYGDLIRWLEGEHTNSNVNYETMFDNLYDLHTGEMLSGYPKFDLDQTRETLKKGASAKGNFVSNFEHAGRRSVYDNQQCMHDNINDMMEKFEKEEEKSYHLCSPCPLLPVLHPGLDECAIEPHHAKMETLDLSQPIKHYIRGRHRGCKRTYAKARCGPPP